MHPSTPMAQLASGTQHQLVRRPLARGEKYIFPGYPNNGFECAACAFSGHPEDDGGLSGAAIIWKNHAGGSYWYPFKTEADFWKDIRFANAVSANGALHRQPESQEGLQDEIR